RIHHLGKDTSDFRCLTWLCNSRQRQNDHYLLIRFRFLVVLTFRSAKVFNSSANSSTKIVCSRPGPVEIMPMRAPLSFSRKARYSRAAFGSFSSFVIPRVGVRQPGIFAYIHLI